MARSSIFSVRRIPAREKLLKAAATVFARDGLNGSTTRAIATEAGVNEITLFRLFKTKDLLLAAVVGEKFGTASVAAASAPVPPAPTDDLRGDLKALAKLYDSTLRDNFPLVRTMIGEIHHQHQSHEREVFRGIFGPLKEALLKRLQSAEADGQLVDGVRVDILADLFGGMLFTGVMRRAATHLKIDYTTEAYLDGALDLVMRATTDAKGAKTSKVANASKAATTANKVIRTLTTSTKTLAKRKK